MKTSVLDGRWGWIVGLAAAALCACGGGQSEGGGSGQTLVGSKNEGLTAPRPGDGLRTASAGTDQIAASSDPAANAELAGSRDLPLTNRLKSDASVRDPSHTPWCLDVRAVAIEGEVAPGTGGQTFDEQSTATDLAAPVGDYGFDEPMVNESGNVAFIASYGHEAVYVATPAPVTSGAAAGDSSASAPATQEPSTTDASSEAPAARQLDSRQCPGAGVFFWDRDEDRLSPVAVAGQYTEAGFLPDQIGDYDGPQINDRDRVAFVARNIQDVMINGPTNTFTPTEGYCNAALFQAVPRDEKCERFDLNVIARTGDPAPGGGYFVSFDDLSENERGDIAFIAFYTEQVLAPGATVKELSTAGVFLYKADSHRIVAVIREGDPLPGTNGGFFCNLGGDLVDGPWLNDDRVITFLADCVEDSSHQRLPDVEGSVFIKRPGEEIALFLRNHSPGPRVNPCDSCSYDETSSHTTINGIEAGRPGISENLAAFKLSLEYGMSTQDVVVTKSLSSDADGKLKVCAFEGEELQREDTLGVGTPSISSDNIIGFAGDVNGWVDGNFEVQEAIFNCTDGSLKKLVQLGDPKPVGKDNTFGSVEEQSNSDRYEVFLDETERPTGVYTSNTHPQRE